MSRLLLPTMVLPADIRPFKREVNRVDGILSFSLCKLLMTVKILSKLFMTSEKKLFNRCSEKWTKSLPKRLSFFFWKFRLLNSRCRKLLKTFLWNGRMFYQNRCECLLVKTEQNRILWKSKKASVSNRKYDDIDFGSSNARNVKIF